MIIERIIERYCARYSPAYVRTKDNPAGVPRFLINDLIRYWRTIAVDFEAKRWRDPKEGWGLRYAKLLSTRKIMFAGSLASYLRSGNYLDLENLNSVEERYAGLMDYLRKESNKPPVARLAAIYEFLDKESQDKLVVCLKCYDAVLQILNQRNAKSALKREHSTEMDEILKQTSELNRLLEEIFFDDSFMRPLTKGYTLL